MILCPPFRSLIETIGAKIEPVMKPILPFIEFVLSLISTIGISPSILIGLPVIIDAVIIHFIIMVKWDRKEKPPYIALSIGYIAVLVLTYLVYCSK